MNDPDDRKLLQSWVAGSHSAFAELVARHGRSIKAYALRMLGHAEIAEEVYADTFERVARDAHRWTDRGTVRGWLFTVAHRRCVDELRRRVTAHRDHHSVVLLQTHWAYQPSPEAESLLGETALQLEQALQTLRPGHRDVVLLRLVHGLTAEQASEVLDCTPGQVDSRLSYARKLLREILADDSDYTSPRRRRHE